ncbi:hypothetical protein KQI82_12120 [Oscillibacter sp. MSJ-2]|uniref:Uncharacterized protein n=1 Tax=Dysosmobacter acutus TaxID=2841504 RepID=A0ABS6FEC7_9FIRM|nr:hypothetical protein [Dysosmobacter acutus]MBU5627654.1 hypothetical protein [Dysosmobacter acutus]
MLSGSTAISLLEAMQLHAGCEYLSDLRQLQGWQRLHLARVLEGVAAEAAPLREWNDALAYLSRERPRETAEAARARLILSLRGG